MCISYTCIYHIHTMSYCCSYSKCKNDLLPLCVARKPCGAYRSGGKPFSTIGCVTLDSKGIELSAVLLAWPFGQLPLEANELCDSFTALLECLPAGFQGASFEEILPATWPFGPLPLEAKELCGSLRKECQGSFTISSSGVSRVSPTNAFRTAASALLL